MAAKQDGWTDLVKLLALSATILVPLVGLIWYQGSELRSEIRDLRTEMRTEIGDLRETVGGLEVSVAGLEVSVANLEGSVGELEGSVGELEGSVAGLEVSVAGLEVSVANLEVAVARIEAREALHPMLAERFAATGEGARFGGPTIAANLLLARALPEIDSVLGTIDQDAPSGLADDLWEDRANILARADPIL